MKSTTILALLALFYTTTAAPLPTSTLQRVPPTLPTHIALASTPERRSTVLEHDKGGEDTPTPTLQRVPATLPTHIALASPPERRNIITARDDGEDIMHGDAVDGMQLGHDCEVVLYPSECMDPEEVEKMEEEAAGVWAGR
ncbi:hypothetical protein MMC13_005857 [Lambiella insularis]|nr:hypothetical protein [Lambiella insularis]